MIRFWRRRAFETAATKVLIYRGLTQSAALRGAAESI
jgi:hypothetical protein